MVRLTWDGTAGPVSRGQILRRIRGQQNSNFPCSADHEQDWQPYPVDPYSSICDDGTYMHTCILTHFKTHNLFARKKCNKLFFAIGVWVLLYVAINSKGLATYRILWLNLYVLVPVFS